ncbi:hypothetical protein D8911_11600 [Levilactobacillus brevis]|nr:hypothetical protein D8911_11600 [Levilactobacillus brevis]
MGAIQVALNQELLTCIQGAESKYGHTDNWPDALLTEIQVLANREPEADAERKEAEWLYRRGFTRDAVALRLHRSAGWAGARKPVITEFEYTDDDLITLAALSTYTNYEAALRMHRNLLWIKEMRRKLNDQ